MAVRSSFDAERKWQIGLVVYEQAHHSGGAATEICVNLTGRVQEISEDAGIEIPETWDCPRCGYPAGQDKDSPPAPVRNEPYKTHLAYVKERRSDQEAADILDEAIQLLRSRRKSGDIIF